MSSAETAPLQKEERRPSFILVHITAISRTWGLLTTVVLWASIIFMINDHERGFIVYYMVVAAILLSFFEITWLLNKCACCGKEGCCCRIWRAIMWIDNWKKFVFYVALSVPLFLEGKKEALGIVTGFMLIILSTMYLVRTFQGSHKSGSGYQRMETGQAPRAVTHETGTQTEVVDEQPTGTS